MVELVPTCYVAQSKLQGHLKHSQLIFMPLLHSPRTAEQLELETDTVSQIQSHFTLL